MDLIVVHFVSSASGCGRAISPWRARPDCERKGLDVLYCSYCLPHVEYFRKSIWLQHAVHAGKKLWVGRLHIKYPNWAVGLRKYAVDRHIQHRLPSCTWHCRNKARSRNGGSPNCLPQFVFLIPSAHTAGLRCLELSSSTGLGSDWNCAWRGILSRRLFRQGPSVKHGL